MSIEMTRAVWGISMSPAEKVVLLALADFANDKGVCWPSIATIERMTGASDRTIQRSIRALEKAGLVRIEQAFGKSNRYHLTPDRVSPPDTVSPRQNGAPPPTDSHPTPDTVSPPPRHSVTQTIIEPSKNHQEPPEVTSSASDDDLTPNDILESWNELAEECGLPRAGKLTGGRLRQAKARLREYPEIEAWKRAFRHIYQTPFLRGENDRGWRADIDFLLQAKSFTKLTEGAYGGEPVDRIRDPLVRAALERQAELAAANAREWSEASGVGF